MSSNERLSRFSKKVSSGQGKPVKIEAKKVSCAPSSGLLFQGARTMQCIIAMSEGEEGQVSSLKF